MNKKFVTAMIVACLCMQGVSVMAAESSALTRTEHYIEETTSPAEIKSQVVARTGEVNSTHERNGNYDILVGGAREGTMFIVQPGTLVFDVETLSYIEAADIKEGMSVTVVLNSNTPMTMSIPPMCSQQVAILVNSPNKNVEVGYFDETLTNEAHTLKLNVSEQTMIQNNEGERRVFTEEDIKGQDAIVIYTASTRSIPAQTTPEYVMILKTGEEVETPSVKTIQPSEYISVRELADTLGYEVAWEHESKTVTLTKGTEEVSFKVGNTEYSKDGVSINLANEIKLENSVVYVPTTLEEVLK